MNNHTILNLEAFPERDNANKRVFQGAKMSVCILNMMVGINKPNLTLRTHWDRFVDKENELVFCYFVRD